MAASTFNHSEMQVCLPSKKFTNSW